MKEELLRTHDWPGNIRELGNLARKVVALGQARVAMSELKRVVPAQGKTIELARNESLKSCCERSGAGGGTGLDFEGAREDALEPQTSRKRITGQLQSLLYKIKQMDVDEAQLKKVQGDD